MSMAVEETDLALARAGDSTAFDRLVRPLRPELHAHCYRMLGSVHDADDAMQDALLRAWRGLARFEGRSSLRTWLYTVTSRICLDIVERRGKRALPVDLGPSSDHAVLDDAPLTDVAWLEPYPDARYERREATELAFVAALQHLPANQRAVLLLFDVLGYSAAEIAELLDTSATAVNSALARARRTIAEKGPALTQQQALRKLGDAKLRERVAGFATALELGDVDTLIRHIADDVTWSMPPLPRWYRGIAAVTDFAVKVPLTGCGRWRCVPTSANNQPAVACYLWDDVEGAYLSWAINVLTFDGEHIVGITSFIGADLTAFGLPHEAGRRPEPRGPRPR